MRLLAASLIGMIISPIFAQSLTVTLPHSADGYAQIAQFEMWPGDYYYLDETHGEIVLATGDGAVISHYGGWGTGAEALDFPVAMTLSENSVWVLDQGESAIIRLDSRLNHVSTVFLADQGRLLAFARDSQQRTWVIGDDRPGITLYDDGGTFVQQVGDGLSGGLIQQPSQIAAGDGLMWVWDEDSSQLNAINLGVIVTFRAQLELDGKLIALTAWGAGVLLLTEQRLLHWDGDSLSVVQNNGRGWVDMSPRGGQMLLLGGQGLDVIDLP